MKPRARRPAVLAFAGIFAALGAGAAAAQAYKWTDAQGKVHFSDAPPPDREAKKISIKPQVPEDPAAAARSGDWRAQLEASGVRRQQDQNRQLAEQRDRQAADSRCANAQRSLDTLQRERPVFHVGKDGQRVYLEDKDRAAALKSAQERAERDCR